MQSLHQQCLCIFLDAAERLRLRLKLLLEHSAYLLFLLQTLCQCILQMSQLRCKGQGRTSCASHFCMTVRHSKPVYRLYRCVHVMHTPRQQCTAHAAITEYRSSVHLHEKYSCRFSAAATPSASSQCGQGRHMQQV